MSAKITVDFGERVTGWRVRDDGSDKYPLVQPKQAITGTVTGLFPHLPGIAVVQTATSEFTVRVTGRA